MGLDQTAMEAGNSESEAKKSYKSAKNEAEAEQWFALKHSKVAEQGPEGPLIH